jgi:hypothetical protein
MFVVIVGVILLVVLSIVIVAPFSSNTEKSRGWIFGRIFWTENDEGLNNTTVRYFTEEYEYINTVSTNDDGEYNIKGLNSGTYIIETGVDYGCNIIEEKQLSIEVMSMAL